LKFLCWVRRPLFFVSKAHTSRGGSKKNASIPNNYGGKSNGDDFVPRKSFRLMTCTSILGCWLLEALEMLQNPTKLLNEATSWRAIGIESIKLHEDKKIFL
jgi:hypothetical protein